MSLPIDALIDGRIKWGPNPKWITDDSSVKEEATSTIGESTIHMLYH